MKTGTTGSSWFMATAIICGRPPFAIYKAPARTSDPTDLKVPAAGNFFHLVTFALRIKSGDETNQKDRGQPVEAWAAWEGGEPISHRLKEDGFASQLMCPISLSSPNISDGSKSAATCVPWSEKKIANGL